MLKTPVVPSWFGRKEPDVPVEKSTLANDIEDESEAPPKEAQELAQPMMKEKLEERTDTPVSKYLAGLWGSKKPENVDVPVEKSTLANDIEDESVAPPKEAQELAQPMMKEKLEERTDTPVSKYLAGLWGSKKPENVDVPVEKSTLANDIEDDFEAPPKEAQELAQPMMKEKLEERTDTPVSKYLAGLWGSKKPENVDVPVEKSTLANDIEDESEAPPKEAQELAQPMMKEKLEERTDTPVSKYLAGLWGSKKPENVDVPVEKSNLANDIEDDYETFPQEGDEEDEEGSLSEEPVAKERPKRSWFGWPQGIPTVDNAQPMTREEVEDLKEELKTPVVPSWFGRKEPDVPISKSTLANDIEDDFEAPPTEQKQSWFSWPQGIPTVDKAQPMMREEVEDSTDTPVSKYLAGLWGSKKPENVDVPVEKSTLANDIEDDFEAPPTEQKQSWFSWPQGIPTVDNAQPMMREEVEDSTDTPVSKEQPSNSWWGSGWGSKKPENVNVPVEKSTLANDIEDESEAPPTEQKQSWFSWPKGNPTMDNAKPMMKEEPEEAQKVDVQEMG